MSEPVDPCELSEFVRKQIVTELQTAGVLAIVHQALEQELLTGVPADPGQVAKQIYEYVKERLLKEQHA
jgi:hypothetical protein